MFEKEAEEEINKEHWNYSIFKDLAQEYWQKGAEFGYNKANEWHYVKDGEHPKPNVKVDVWVKLSKNYETKYMAYWRPTIKKWQISNLMEASRQPKDDDFLDENEVIAWKEIVLPKE